MVELDQPTSSRPTRLGIVADPHLATDSSGSWKCYHRTETFFNRALDRVQATDPDAVVVAGDLTKDGEEHNFNRYDELASQLSNPITVPGNHDVPKEYTDHETMPLEAFAARYTDDGYPFRRRVGGLDLLCLNSATMPDESLRDTWGGKLSESQLEWLAAELETARNPVVVLHHNLFVHSEHDGAFGSNFQLANSHQLRAVLDPHAPVLVISGHHHIPSIHSEGGITELISPAVCSYPPSALVVTVRSAGTRVTRLPVTTPAERTESYTYGLAGSALGRRIVKLAEDRLRAEPFR